MYLDHLLKVDGGECRAHRRQHERAHAYEGVALRLYLAQQPAVGRGAWAVVHLGVVSHRMPRMVLLAVPPAHAVVRAW